MTFRSRSQGRCRLLAAGVTAVVLAGAGALAAVAGPAGAAGAAAAPAASRTAAGAARPGLLSAAQAGARARSQGRPVIASALTTPTSQTTVSPAGISTTTESLLPTRAWRGGGWRALDPDLRASGGTVAPAVTANGLVLSGGGSAPLAVLDNHGRTLSLSWPGPLPRPTLSGATATYHGVLPGVNLAVTVTPQGGFSEVLIVTSAKAAADPALARLVLRASAPGMRVSVADGELRVAASAAARPVFTAPPPQMWDSTPAPARTKTVTVKGTVLAVPSGLPADPSAAGPGAGSRMAQVPFTVSGSAIVLSPPASALTGRGVTYPVYIDPSFEPDPVGVGASNWTQVDSGFPTTSYWDEGSYLQMGLCDWEPACNYLGVARTYFTMPMPSEITSTTTVDTADLYMTNVWSATCTAEPAHLYGVAAISPSTTWNTQPGWGTYQQQSFSNACNGSYTDNNVTWNFISNVQGAQANGYGSMTTGLFAASESTDLQWKQFLSGSGNITLSISYHNPPSTPASLQNAPAGACQASSSSPASIGNDDVTLSATVGDVDNADGDDALSTTFAVYSEATGAAEATYTDQTDNAAGGLTASVTIPRGTIEGWAPDHTGSITAYTYYWEVYTSDDGSPVLTSPTAGPCYFTYQPIGPGQPAVSFPDGNGSGSTKYPIGSTIPVNFTASGCTTGGTDPCPVSYTYQAGVAASVTVDATAGDWSGSIRVSQVGPIELTVYGTDASGNQGQPSQGNVFDGATPATAYPDGYFTGGSYPSVLTTGTGADPSLWLSAGTGSGTLAPAADVGSLGTLISPGTDGPGDWAGAIVLHGDFTGHDVEDVMAYYPTGTHAGAGVVIGGPGTAAPLIPYSGNVWGFSDGQLSDPTYSNSDNPSVLTGAGNASEHATTGLDDLIGILGDTSSADDGTGYELDLYSATTTGQYNWQQVLSTTAPDGSADWNDYALVTAQPGGNPSAVVLFALDKATGALYESVNPTCDTTVITGCGQGPSSTLVGMPGTWTTIAAPWGATAPALVSADVNSAGSIELWTMTGSTLTPYVVSGTAATAENSGTAVSYPAHDWQLNDGSQYALGSSASAATDSITASSGDKATFATGSSWGTDDFFSEDASLNPSSSGTNALTTSGPIVSTVGSYTVSAWVKLDGLPGYNETVLAQDGATDSGFYLGYNWYCGGCWGLQFVATDTDTPAFDDAYGTAAQPGVWTNLTGVYNATSKTGSLYVNGSLAATTSVTGWAATGPFTIGRALYNGSKVNYLNGSVADVQTWNSALTAAQVGELGLAITPVTSVTVQAWGGGGGGAGSNTTDADAAPGGGGGEYASQTVAVTPGETYTVVVGAGGAGGAAGTNPGKAGGKSWFGPSSAVVTGYAGGGGTAASSDTGGSGGTGSTNTICYNGGAGGIGSIGSLGEIYRGGGGGGSGGTGSAGDTGAAGSVSGYGATAVTGGGAGGNGGNAGQPTDGDGAGVAGAAPGGGGGGGEAYYASGEAGGNGAAGQITITWANGSQTWSTPGTYQWTAP
jgi:Concanavalin A-like lectin/glucanases superfamily